jgi:hypothetical protein
MGPAKRAATQQVNWRIDAKALDLLTQLEPQPHRRGQYISSLIVQAAQGAGIVDRPTTPDYLDLAVLQRQLQDIQARVTAALEQQKDAK